MGVQLDNIDVEPYEHTFTFEYIESWCEDNQYTMPEDEVFSGDCVPTMAIMNAVGSAVSVVGGDEHAAVLSGIVAARFRDPVLVGETVEVRLELVDSTKTYTLVDFAVRVAERNSLAAHGSVNVAVEKI